MQDEAPDLLGPGAGLSKTTFGNDKLSESRATPQEKNDGPVDPRAEALKRKYAKAILSGDPRRATKLRALLDHILNGDRP
jgi:hypothetical protein